MLDLEGVDFVDSQGVAKKSDIHEPATADRVTLRLMRLKPNVLRVLEANGIVELVGADHIHGNVDRAIEAELAVR